MTHKISSSEDFFSPVNKTESLTDSTQLNDNDEQEQAILSPEDRKVAESYRRKLNQMRIEELEDKIAIYTDELTELKNEMKIENKEMN